MKNLFLRVFVVIGFYGCSSDTGTNPTGGTTVTSSINATFSSIQQNVFTASCAISGCHNGAQTPNLSAGVAHNNIVNARSTRGVDYIEPGDPDNSYLYRKLIGVNISGDRMPRGRSALSQAVTDSIKTWIQKGAPNN